MADHDDLSYDPWDVDIDLDPYPTYARLRTEAPVYYNEEVDFWALSRYADVEAALKDFANLSSAKGDILEVVKAEPTIPLGVFINEDPPLHTVHRALVSRMFTPRNMRDLEGRIRASCAECLDPLVGEERFDFMTDLGFEMPMRVLGMLVGIPEDDLPHVRAVAKRRLEKAPGEPMRVSKKNYFNGELFRDYVEWRRRNPSDDLVTELLSVEFEDVDGRVRKLDDDELLIFLGVIANAGVDTVSRLFGWLGKSLGEHPDQRRAVAADRSLIPNTIEEVLRYEPPTPHIARSVARDVVFGDRTIPRGAALLLIVASANRDEREISDPARFDITRTPGHLTFGHGTHFCLGASLARTEGRIALDEILDRWTDWTVDHDHAVRSATSAIRGWDSMPTIVG